MTPNGHDTNDTESDIPHPERYALIEVIAPDGVIEDTVKVQFGYEQPLGIGPLKHAEEGRFPDDYKLQLKHLVIDGTRYLAKDNAPSEMDWPEASE